MATWCRISRYVTRLATRTGEGEASLCVSSHHWLVVQGSVKWEDGSVRADIGDPRMFAMTLWAFTHGIIQLATIKGGDFARHGIAINDFTNNAFVLLRRMAQVPGTP